MRSQASRLCLKNETSPPNLPGPNATAYFAAASVTEKKHVLLRRRQLHRGGHHETFRRLRGDGGQGASEAF
jgi:hypothetical protein